MTMPKVKMGSLIVDKKVWVRQQTAMDHVECMTNDLVAGVISPESLVRAKPPVKVEKNTRIIINGNHRFIALRRFYGKDWAKKEIEVEFVSLPPFEKNPEAWWKEALIANPHNVQRLQGPDREGLARALLRTLDDLTGEQGQEFARLIHYTPRGWIEFVKTYFEAMERTMPSDANSETASVRNDVTAIDDNNERPVKDTITVISDSSAKLAKGKTPATGDTGISPIKEKGYGRDHWPSDIKREQETPRAKLHQLIAKMIDLLDQISPDMLTERDRQLLEELVERITLLVDGAA
jgi:hypothetical protein